MRDLPGKTEWPKQRNQPNNEPNQKQNQAYQTERLPPHPIEYEKQKQRTPTQEEQTERQRFRLKKNLNFILTRFL